MKSLLVALGILSFIFWPSAFVSADFDKTGNHYGEAGNLEYSIEYLEPKGVTTANNYGLTFKPFGFDLSFLPQILPAKYFGDYPLYFTGDTLNFKVHLKNTGKRTFRNLKVFAFQEFFNASGGKGNPIGGENQSDWFLAKLGSGEEVVLDGVFEIPLVGESGLDQTHLQILHWPGDDSDSDSNGRVIVDDRQAGIWCPTIK